MNDMTERSVSTRSSNDSWIVISGTVLLLLGTSTLAGWHFNLPILLSVSASLPPTAYLSGLAYFFSGVALFALRRHSVILVDICAGVVLFLGAFALLEPFLPLDLPMSRLLVKEIMQEGMPHFIRMAPATAVCFVLFGGCLLFYNSKLRTFPFIAGPIGAAIFAAAVMCFVYLGWNLGAVKCFLNLNHLSLISSIGILVLGVSILFAARSRSVLERSMASVWWASICGTACLAVTFLFWQALTMEQGLFIQTKLPAFALALGTVASLLLSYCVYSALQTRFYLAITKEAQLRFEELFRNIRDAILVIDVSGKILEGNAAVLDIFGYALSEIKGLALFSLLQNPLRLEEQLKQLQFSEGKQNIGDPYFFKRKDTSVFAGDVGVFPTHGSFGELSGFVILVRDATERVRIEEQSRISAYMRGVIEANQDAVLTLDEEGIIIDANLSTEKLFGISTRRIVGGYFQSFVEDSGALNTILERVKSTGRHETCIVHIKYFSKADVIAELAISPLPPSSSNSKSALCINARDVSEIKKAEAETQHYIQELARSNKDLENFAHMASHDLKGPMRTISNYIQLLGQSLKGTLSEEQNVYLQITVQGLTRMQRLIDDILQFASVGKKMAKWEWVNCNQLVREVVSSLEIPIKEKNACVEIEDLPMVWGVESYLQQVFQNLIENALKFQKNESAKVVIKSFSEGDVWGFSIKDNGIGFDEKYAKEIFQIFTRLSSSNAYPGSGLGLAICRRLVEAQGGKIWVHSKAGAGSEFYFTLPYQKESPSIAVGERS